MQELKLFQGAPTLYACRTSPPSFPHTRHIVGGGGMCVAKFNF